MNAKNLLEGRTGPITQSIDSVKALLSWKGRASDPLPQFVELGKDEGKLVLVLSNKRDAYYTCTARACSCPVAVYGHGQRCKHQRKYFPVAREEQSKELGIIRPDTKTFRPFDTLPREERAEAAAEV